jgi:hypothetical protein
MPGAESAAIRGLRAFGRGLLRVPRGLGFLPPLLWAALIFYGSSHPAPAIAAPGFAGALIENCGHAVEYGIFAALLALCAKRRSAWVDLDRATVAWMLAVIVVYAASDEWHQSFVPHRDASVYDVITDIVGGVSTLACIDALGEGRGGRTFSLRFAIGFAASLAAAVLATLEP